MSRTGSSPTMRAGTRLPESSVTDSEAAPSTTWAFVSTWPSLSMMTPEPTTVSKRRWGLALLIFIDWIDTTAGETRSNSMVRDSVHGWADAPVGTSSARASATRKRMDPDHTPRRDATRQAREYNRGV